MAFRSALCGAVRREASSQASPVSKIGILPERKALSASFLHSAVTHRLAARLLTGGLSARRTSDLWLKDFSLARLFLWLQSQLKRGLRLGSEGLEAVVAKAPSGICSACSC